MYSLVGKMAERDIKCNDDSEPALKPEIGRELCRMKIFRGGGVTGKICNREITEVTEKIF